MTVTACASPVAWSVSWPLGREMAVPAATRLPVKVNPAPNPPVTVGVPVSGSRMRSPPAVMLWLEPRTPVMSGVSIVRFPGVEKDPTPLPRTPPVALMATFCQPAAANAFEPNWKVCAANCNVPEVTAGAGSAATFAGLPSVMEGALKVVVLVP